MGEIVFEMDVAGPAGPVVAALTTGEGIRSWWTDDVSLDGGVGSTMTLGFSVAPLPFHLRVDTASDREVVWSSIGDFPPHWANTTIAWTITSNDASCTVGFAHTGWAEGDAGLGAAAFTWGQLLVRLKAFVEDGAIAPFFTR